MFFFFFVPNERFILGSKTCQYNKINFTVAKKKKLYCFYRKKSLQREGEITIFLIPPRHKVKNKKNTKIKKKVCNVNVSM